MTWPEATGHRPCLWPLRPSAAVRPCALRHVWQRRLLGLAEMGGDGGGIFHLLVGQVVTFGSHIGHICHPLPMDVCAIPSQMYFHHGCTGCARSDWILTRDGAIQGRADDVPRLDDRLWLWLWLWLGLGLGLGLGVFLPPKAEACFRQRSRRGG